MKNIAYIFFPLLLLMMVSCGTVSVVTDYDTKVDFSKFKTFAFYKKGIDKASVSDLDKKRIMRAIQTELEAKGMTVSETPDVLVSIFAKSEERVDVNDGFYGGFYGGFYYPWYYGAGVNVSRYSAGTLFIDVLDGNKKDLLWQGIGRGTLTNRSPEHKTERINEFVKEILAAYPLSIR